MVTSSPMRVQQAVLAALAGNGNAATVERIGKMLRRFPPDVLEASLKFLAENGMIELREPKKPDGKPWVRLTDHFRLPRPRRERPSAPPPIFEPPRPPPEPEPIIELAPVAYADSEGVREALRICVEEARRFVRGEVYLGPFMKRRMNAAFPRMTNEERKGLIDHLRELGCLRIEKRLGDRGEYSVLLLEQGHPATRQIWREMAASSRREEYAEGPEERSRGPRAFDAA